ncbi:MAG: hypothetical protein ACXVQ7_13660 [Actinomycetota bacterium]
MSTTTMECDLQHDRPRAAVVRVQVKSTRVGRPGRPMIRELAVCKMHAQQLRTFGIEVVAG